MQRIWVPAGTLRPGKLVIRDPRQAHHCVRVCRVREGEAVECFDGQGARGEGQVVQVRSDEIVVAVSAVRADSVPPVRLHVAAALIRPTRFDWMLEKLTELGADEISPIITNRTTIRPKAGEQRHRMERWQRLMAGAARQCGGSRIPRLYEPRPFEAFLREIASSALTLIPTLGAVDSLQSMLADVRTAAEVVVLIGPEGDFTSEEVRLAQAQGIRPVSLGDRVLRSETAAVALVAVLRYLMERG